MGRSGVWGGRTTEQRQVERRTRMIAKAVKIWSDEGWAAVSMRRICSETSVNDRYFYEEFGDRDALLAATWETVRDDALATLNQAYAVWGGHPSWKELTQEVALALLDWMTVNPSYARILLSRDESNSTLEALHRNAFHQAVDLVIEVARPRLGAGFDEDGLKMDAVTGVGGFIELLRAWQSGYLKVDVHRIAEHTSSSAARYTGRHRSPSPRRTKKPGPANGTGPLG